MRIRCFLALALAAGTAHAADPFAAPGELAFERAAPEFPHRLVLRKNDARHFYSRVEGALGGKPKTLEFPMTRVSCERK